MNKNKRFNINDEQNITEAGCEQEHTVPYFPNIDFSVEPSNEKDYDIDLMTGKNNEKGGEKK